MTITLLMMTPGEYEVFITRVFAGKPPAWLPIRNALKAILNGIFVVMAIVMAFGKSSVRLSQARRIWLRSLAIVPAVVLIFFTYVAIFSKATARLSGGSGTPFLILSFTMAVLIYAVSFLLFIAPEVSEKRKEPEPATADPLCPEEECRRLAILVDKRFAEGAFRDPDLTLADLAAQLKVSSNRLSFAINHSHQRSFRTLLNCRRLEYFVDKIEEGQLAAFTWYASGSFLYINYISDSYADTVYEWNIVDDDDLFLTEEGSDTTFLYEKYITISTEIISPR